MDNTYQQSATASECDTLTRAESDSTVTATAHALTLRLTRSRRSPRRRAVRRPPDGACRDTLRAMAGSREQEHRPGTWLSCMYIHATASRTETRGCCTHDSRQP